ncbi:platelet-derived growth factor receptor beta-like [Paramacrobiotus metropolitanus]|uniref:platelet-derived growth factor receptor beta-like n=1 Tax=Paramacrobiotus metropolitanus TaxID=2943436 RepID=UPI002445D811|nr:platelet-derived growth factor receptor beta-like [Paramacrobiotus metropolitanus]
MDRCTLGIFVVVIGAAVWPTAVWCYVGVDVTHFVDIFRDDFTADGPPDPAKWNVGPPNKKNAFPGELQTYRRENVVVENGYLHIFTRKEEFNDYNYTSGRVDTQGLFDFQFGEIEWRAKVPSPRGINPAIWLLHYQCYPGAPCKKWQTNVKVSRGDSGNQTIQTVTNWKYPQSKLPRYNAESRNSTASLPTDLSLDFHIYKIIWTSEELIWVIDDVAIFNVTGQDVPSTRMQIVMSVTVGGPMGPFPAADTKFPTEFLIDYVVVRQPANITGPPRPPPASSFIMPLLVGLFGGILMVFIGLAGAYFYWRRRRARKKAKHPVSLQHATSLTALSNVYRRSSAYVNAVIQQDPTFEDYLKLLDIDPTSLTSTGQLLGKGQYGFVYKGVIKNLPTSPDTETLVAIKSLIEYDDAEQQKQFIEEMRIMKKVGRHLNIVNLIGLCRSDKILLIFEYCPHGSLLKFLRSRRRTFTDQVDAEGYLIAKGSSIPDEQAPETPTGYVRVVSGSDYMSTTSSVTGSCPEDALTTCDLINFAYQISNGLEYLALQSIIHRDIAARNILVADNYVVKIADFGMARRRLLTDYSMSSDQVALPIKWMAPESILHRTFSYKSDVWSFGVLLWEIFSLGDVPYSSTSGGSQFNGNIAQFVNSLTNGARMHRPPYSPLPIYEIIGKCWELQIENRPSIDIIRQDLAQLISPASSEFYLKLEEPYINYNSTFRKILNTGGTHAPVAAQSSVSSAYQVMERQL